MRSSGRVVSLALLPLLAACGVRQAAPPRAAPPQELPTKWEAPPGDPIEHETAGFAKVLCSALFITGRDLDAAVEEDGYFVAPPEARRAAGSAEVDRKGRSVSLTLPGGVRRTARLYGDQGCVTLPRGEDTVHFTPVEVRPSLPDPAAQPWPMGDLLPGGPLPEGVDAAKVAQATAAAFDPPEALTAAFVVAHRGRIIAERYQQGLDRTTRLPSWSMGKSLTATLIGQLVHEGVYDLWGPAPVEEWQGAEDPRRAIRIADLLRMSSGLRFISPMDPDYDAARGYPDHLYVYTGAIDAQRWSVTRPPQWLPNTVGRYRNSDPLVLNHLIRKAALARGEEYLAYPQRHLFDKLGIRRMVLETDPYGNFLLNGYDLGSGRDWLRLGLLYLQDGVWNGERLLPEGWVDFVRTPAPAWEKPEYGGMFWLNRTGAWPVPEDAYYMSGAGGQSTLIIPTHDLVVVRLGHYKGESAGEKALARALALLVEAVPKAREPWRPLPVEELIDLHTGGAGGREAVEQTRTLRYKLRIVEPAFAVDGVYVVDRKGRMRIDIFDGEKRVFTEAFDGRTAWQIEADGSGSREPGEEGKAALWHGTQSPLKVLGLHELANLGHKAEALGRQSVGGILYHVVRVTLSDGWQNDYYLDPESYQIARSRDHRALHPDVDPAKKRFETVWSDYRPVHGVRRAFREEQNDLATGKVVQTTTVFSIEANVDLDERIFRRP